MYRTIESARKDVSRGNVTCREVMAWINRIVDMEEPNEDDEDDCGQFEEGFNEFLLGLRDVADAAALGRATNLYDAAGFGMDGVVVFADPTQVLSIYDRRSTGSEGPGSRGTLVGMDSFAMLEEAAALNASAG